MVEVKRKPNNFLGVKDLWINIKELPKYFKILLLVAIVLILFFNFFNVQGASQGWDTGTGTNLVHHAGWFVPLARYHGALDGSITSTFGNTRSGAIAVAVLYSLNGLASFSGVLALAMIISGKTSQYFWGLINAVFYGAFALSVGYLGDLVMNVILILGASLGWYLFEVKGLAYKTPKKYSWRFNLGFYIYTAIAATICVLVVYEFLPGAFNDTFGKLAHPRNSNNPYIWQATATSGYTATRVLDSLTNGIQIVGYAMQLTNMPQQFVVWLVVDVIKILKFTNIAPNTLSVNMLIEFAVWLTIASYGAIKSYVLPMIQMRKRA